MTCEYYEGGLVVCRPSRDDIKPLFRATTLWCFECRRRTLHWLYVIVGEWYDPEAFWKCSLCLGSHTEFPA